MSAGEPRPRAITAAADDQADWLELRALQAIDRNSSMQDLIAEVQRVGTGDALDEEDREDDPGVEKGQQIAEAALDAVSERRDHCGGVPFYPFEITSQHIQAVRRVDSAMYTFLLLLSEYGKDAGPDDLDGAKLFEEVSASAAISYFGGEATGARSYLFGFPRRTSPKAFADALDDLCKELGEGGGCRYEREPLPDQKDAKLDLVVWRPFKDRRHSQLIAFGQCATGANWEGKVTELQSIDFCTFWIRDPTTIRPIRLFFVPFRVGMGDWDLRATYAGVLFDRCRIASNAQAIPKALRDECVAWSKFVICEKLRS